MPAQHERIDFHGLPASRLRLGGATLTVTDFGAHICSWKTADGVERLFLSERAIFDARVPIRGGVPVIFPQFGPDGPLKRHGFARNLMWRQTSANLQDDFGALTWRIESDATTLPQWPHVFAVELTALLSHSRLDIELEVECLGEKSFDFQAALHTYLSVSEVEHARLIGLQDCEYLDQMAQGTRKTEQNETIAVEGETDRVYLKSPSTLLLREARRSIEIQTLGFAETVVWNPWESGSRTIKDMKAGEFRHMLCVEAANAHSRVTLYPGAIWIGRQSLIAQ